MTINESPAHLITIVGVIVTTVTAIQVKSWFDKLKLRKELKVLEKRIRVNTQVVVCHAYALNPRCRDNMLAEIADNDFGHWRTVPFCTRPDNIGLVPTGIWSVLCWLTIRQYPAVYDTAKQLEEDLFAELKCDQRIARMIMCDNIPSETLNALFSRVDSKTSENFSWIYQDIERYRLVKSCLGYLFK